MCLRLLKYFDNHPKSAAVNSENFCIVTGIRKGRGGLGAIFVWATGNGGHYDDYCSCDGYITSIFTVSIGAVNDRGKSPWYAEPCPSTLAVTYSSGETQGRQDKQIVTTDLHHSCTKSHTGTSAAAPLAAGLSLSNCLPCYDAGLFFSLRIHRSAMFTCICYMYVMLSS